jgi:MraZ protein
MLLRMLLGTASELEIDATGSITVPQALRDFAGLETEAVLVGQGRYFEVWTPALWQKQTLRLQDAEANAERFAGLMITG